MATKQGPPYGQVRKPPAVKLEQPMVYVREDGTERPAGRARQSEKDSCDINRIMARYEKTGVLPDNVRQLVYMDVSEVGDYRAVLDRVRFVDKSFMALPAHVRAEFQNDPAAFLDFCSDENNRDALVEMGLVEAPEDPVTPDEPNPGVSDPPVE